MKHYFRAVSAVSNGHFVLSTVSSQFAGVAQLVVRRMVDHKLNELHLLRE